MLAGGRSGPTFVRCYLTIGLLARPIAMSQKCQKLIWGQIDRSPGKEWSIRSISSNAPTVRTTRASPGMFRAGFWSTMALRAMAPATRRAGRRSLWYTRRGAHRGPAALKEEMRIKRLTRGQKQTLISGAKV